MTYYRQRDGIVKSVESLIQRAGTALAKRGRPRRGRTGTLASFLAEQMRTILGQPVVIENVGGAAGGLSVGGAVLAPRDGGAIG